MLSHWVYIKLLPTRVLGFLRLIEIDQRSDKKFRQDFTGAPVAAGGSETYIVATLVTGTPTPQRSVVIWLFTWLDDLGDISFPYHV